MNAVKPITKFGSRMQELGISQNALAKQSRVSRPFINALVCGTANPSLKTARILAGALYTSVDKIV